MAVSGVFAGGGKFRGNSGKTAGKFPESRNAMNSRISGTGKSLDLVPTFRAGCFSKSTVPAFSSFSDQNSLCYWRWWASEFGGDMKFNCSFCYRVNKPSWRRQL